MNGRKSLEDNVLSGHNPINPSEFCELLADADRPHRKPTERWKRIAAVHAKLRGAKDGDVVRFGDGSGDWVIDGMTVRPVPEKSP